jgi:S-formylglutathione hydrolase
VNIEKLKCNKSFDGETAFYAHDSKITQTKMNFSIYMPAGNNPEGCLVWLSGLTCNEENFITKACAQQYLSELNMMVICPDTSPRGLDLPEEHESWDFGSAAGFYLNATTEGYKQHYKMFDYISQEVVDLLTDNFNIDKNKISISGHSMGGHGALVLGLSLPTQFASISAFSPIVNPMNCPWGQKAFAGYLSDPSEGVKYDACELIMSDHRHPHQILIDQGGADEFLEKELLSHNFEKCCTEKQQALELNYREGYDHSYYFISTFINAHLEFHKKAWNS